MVDVAHHMRTERTAPEAPGVPVWVPDGQPVTRTPGGAANVAKNVRGLGEDCSLISPYCSCGTITGYFFGSSTTTKNRWYAGDELKFRFDNDVSPNPLQLYNAVQAVLEELNQPKVKAIILSDYGKGALTKASTQTIINAAKRKGIITVVDPKGYDLDKYDGADWLTPNLEEAKTLGLGRDTLFMGGVRRIVMKAGPEPVMFMSKEGTSFVEVPPSKVVDPTGAGDSFIAGLTVALVRRMPAIEAIKYAIRCAQEACAHLGTYACSR